MNSLGKQGSFGLLFGDTAWVAAYRDTVNEIVHVVRDAEAYVAAQETETSQIICDCAIQR